MPTQVQDLTEQQIAAMAPGNTLNDGRALIKKGAFTDPARSEDGTLVFAQCKGSGSTPYQVSVQLHAGDASPTPRCSCPSRVHPCKHAIGLLLIFSDKGRELPVAEPPAELKEKAEKLAGRKEKDTPAEAAPEKEKKPRKVNVAAQSKKAGEQQAALATLETLLADLVTAGLGGLGAQQTKSIQDQAKRMADADLQGPRGLLLRLAALLGDGAPAAGKKAGKAKKGQVAAPDGDEERQTRLVDLVTRLWATVRKGQKVLENKLDAGETQSEADAHVESILGKRWNLDELKTAGYWVKDRTLLELAHERQEDTILDMVLTTGWLLELGDGAIPMERTILPSKINDGHRQSRNGVLTVKEAALYPGTTVNHRIRWDEKEAGVASERPRKAEDYARVHALARPLEPALKAYRDQIKDPLNPYEAVVLLAATRFGVAEGDVLVMEDPAGARLVFRDPADTQYATTFNLRHAAGAYGPGSVLVRLWYDLRERAIFGQALALVAGEEHLRLGL